MFVSLEYLLKVLTASWQHQLVSWHLSVIISNQCYIVEIFFISQLSKWFGYIWVKVIPFEAELFRHLKLGFLKVLEFSVVPILTIKLSILKWKSSWLIYIYIIYINLHSTYQVCGPVQTKQCRDIPRQDCTEVIYCILVQFIYLSITEVMTQRCTVVPREACRQVPRQGDIKGREHSNSAENCLWNTPCFLIGSCSNYIVHYM